MLTVSIMFAFHFKSIGQPINFDCLRKNSLPCLGLVRISDHISFVGNCSTFTSPWSIMSLMKEYWIFVCYIFFKLNMRPFFSSIMPLWLSWYMMFLLILCPRDSITYLACKILGSESCIPINSPLVELLPLVLCFLEKLIVALLPIVIMALVCPLQSSCVA